MNVLCTPSEHCAMRWSITKREIESHRLKRDRERGTYKIMQVNYGVRPARCRFERRKWRLEMLETVVCNAGDGG
jgi:hypothetical protein